MQTLPVKPTCPSSLKDRHQTSNLAYAGSSPAWGTLMSMSFNRFCIAMRNVHKNFGKAEDRQDASLKTGNMGSSPVVDFTCPSSLMDRQLSSKQSNMQVRVLPGVLLVTWCNRQHS